MNIRYLLILVCTLFFNTIRAQMEYGIDLLGGAGLVDIEGTNAPQNFKERLGLSGSAGFSLSYFSKKHIGLYASTGLNISYISANFDFEDSDFTFLADAPFVASNFRSTTSNIVFSVPMVVGYRSNRFSLETGLETFYNSYQGSRNRWDETFQDLEIKVSERTENELRNDFLLSTSTQFAYQLSSKIGVRLKINVGLSDYFKLERPTLNPDYKSTLHSAFLGLRYYL